MCECADDLTEPSSHWIKGISVYDNSAIQLSVETDNLHICTLTNLHIIISSCYSSISASLSRSTPPLHMAGNLCRKHLAV